jgi:hypothetical protein
LYSYVFRDSLKGEKNSDYLCKGGQIKLKDWKMGTIRESSRKHYYLAQKEKANVMINKSV